MGHLATAEALVLRWDEVLKDPSLQDLPYKIELNAWGKVEMSPASNRHGRLQMAIGTEPAELEERRAAYLDAGAQEVWLVAQDGSVRYFDRAGEIASSGFPVQITLPPPMEEYR